ncbi:MAG: AMP-binding protein [Spirulinaceae cyanobacterium RM2_2_10]|nr:AMP-binding protein [Spirulinaceae cyanobacterium RM2_2_10]
MALSAFAITAAGGDRRPLADRFPHVLKCSRPATTRPPLPPPSSPSPSGSTARPKAMLRTHGLLLAQHQALKPVLQFRAGAIEATALPLFVLPNLAAGLTVLLPPVNWRSPGQTHAQPVINALRQHRAERLLAAPALLQRLTDWSLARGVSLPDLRHIFLGGAPVLPALVAQLQQLAPAAEITAVYGSTEAEPIASLRHTAITATDLARVQAGGGLPAGQPVAAINLRILQPQVDDSARSLSPAAFAAATQPISQVGEIIVSGAHVLSSYLDPADNARCKLRVGETLWHRTGDAGYLDTQGRLWLLGRCRGRVQDGAGTIYPLAVEAIANNYPGVRRSALVSLSGERTLLIELAAPTNLEPLRQAITPLGVHRLERCRRLPVDRRHNAKLDYAVLERWLARRR